MLPLIALVIVVALVALAGGGVVWMVLAGIVAPELAAGGSAIVLIGSCVALGLLIARAKARRTERDIHTIRRSQSVRERQPLRYELQAEAEAEDEPELARPLPPIAPPSPATMPDDATGPAAPARAPDDAALALWLEPVVTMPRNETDAWRALPGDGERPLDVRSLADADRARIEMWTLRAAMRLVGKLDAPLICAVGPAMLGDREIAMEVRRLVADDPAAATRIVLAADLDAPDSLASGRLDDLIDEGIGLALDRPPVEGIDRAMATRAAERGAGMALFSATALDVATAARPVRLLREAGIETVGIDVPDEDAMLRLADHGVMRFAGGAFGPPRRARVPGTARPAPNALPAAHGKDASGETRSPETVGRNARD